VLPGDSSSSNIASAPASEITSDRQRDNVGHDLDRHLAGGDVIERLGKLRGRAVDRTHDPQLLGHHESLVEFDRSRRPSLQDHSPGRTYKLDRQSGAGDVA